jgi:hypothetical protein
MPSFSTAGNGIKIGIIDRRRRPVAHPFFDPAGYTNRLPASPRRDTALYDGEG